MINLDDARNSIGAKVRYNAQGGGQEELGVIVEVRGDFVFVLYLGDRAPKATNPFNLDLVNEVILR